MVILNEAKRSEESKIADCKTTSSVGRNPRFLATLGMTRRRGVGLIIATILFTYPYQPVKGEGVSHLVRRIFGT